MYRLKKKYFMQQLHKFTVFQQMKELSVIYQLLENDYSS